jgi:hypothetical protein
LFLSKRRLFAGRQLIANLLGLEKAAKAAIA